MIEESGYWHGRWGPQMQNGPEQHNHYYIETMARHNDILSRWRFYGSSNYTMYTYGDWKLSTTGN